MKRLTIALVILLVLGSLFSAHAHANILNPPVQFDISSDYGPRILDGSFDFHSGIDYASPMGTDVKAVEAGIISEIGYREFNGGHYIKVKGDAHGLWSYAHLFNDDELPIDFSNFGWILMEADLIEVDSSGFEGVTDTDTVLILWGDQTEFEVQKVLCRSQYSGRRVSIGGNIIFRDAYGNEIRSQGRISAREPIAPSGKSGHADIHLHLSLRKRDGSSNGPLDNALLYVKHPPDNLPTITVNNPLEGEHFVVGESSMYTIKVTVDSTQGLDVDNVEFLVYKDKKRTEAESIAEFKYGGRHGEARNPLANTESNGTTNGVNPFKEPEDEDYDPGNDKFIFNMDFSKLGLSEGEHFLAVRVRDINGNETEELRTFIYGCVAVTFDEHSECTRNWCEPDTDPTAVIVHNDPLSPDELGLCNECVDGEIVPRNTDDNNECTIDSCDPETGNIINVDKTEEEIGYGNKCDELPDGSTKIVPKDPDEIDECYKYSYGEVVPKSDNEIGLCNECAPVTAKRSLTPGADTPMTTPRSGEPPALPWMSRIRRQESGCFQTASMWPCPRWLGNWATDTPRWISTSRRTLSPGTRFW
jgi:hypothetical protein